jgi:hypothetical protein
MRKWLAGVLIVGLIGVLIAGAVIRTMDKTEQPSNAQGVERDRDVEGLSGRGFGAGESLDRLPENEKRYEQNRDSQQSNGRQYVQRVNNLDGNGQRYGQGLDSRTCGNETTGGLGGASQAQVEEWIMFEGTIAGIQDDALTVELIEGGELMVEGRAWSFAQDQGFSTQIGNQVTLAGFYEGDDFEVGKITDQSAGNEVALREIGGRPLWAGNGRRGAQG